MSEIFKGDPVDAEIEYWKRVRQDIGKFDRIIVNNFVQHMTLLVGLITLSAYLFQGNPNLSFLSSAINGVVVLLTMSFRKQNSIYQKLIKKNIEVGRDIEKILFKPNYGLTEVLAESLSAREQKHTYTNCYIVIGVVAGILALFFLFIYICPAFRLLILGYI